MNIFNAMWVGFVLWLSKGQNFWSMATIDKEYNITIIFHPLLVKLFEGVAPDYRLWLAGLLVFIALAFFLLVLHPLAYGCRSYLRHLDDTNRMVSGFGEDYLRIVKAYFLRDLKILFGLVFFVYPGIRNFYRYYFLPEILEDHPSVNASEALRIADEYTEGGLLMLVLFDLSFIGWDFLALVMPIVGYIFVYPYLYIAREILYIRM